MKLALVSRTPAPNFDKPATELATDLHSANNVPIRPACCILFNFSKSMIAVWACRWRKEEKSLWTKIVNLQANCQPGTSVRMVTVNSSSTCQARGIEFFRLTNMVMQISFDLAIVVVVSWPAALGLCACQASDKRTFTLKLQPPLSIV